MSKLRRFLENKNLLVEAELEYDKAIQSLTEAFGDAMEIVTFHDVIERDEIMGMFTFRNSKRGVDYWYDIVQEFNEFKEPKETVKVTFLSKLSDAQIRDAHSASFVAGFEDFSLEEFKERYLNTSDAARFQCGFVYHKTKAGAEFWWDLVDKVNAENGISYE